MATIVPYSKHTLSICAQELQGEGLVSFPTETVYGLGANALNANALEKIFQAKARPKSDPLIVHIANKNDIESLTNMSVFQRKCVDILAQQFWPGPLTLIVRASALVPKIVTAQSDFVGLRIPSHPVAQELLRQAGVPVAAPSANRFAHVSPTTAQHVFDDLKDYPNLLILDTDVPCTIGLESTVIKILDDKEVVQLRPGVITLQQIQDTLAQSNIAARVTAFQKEIVTHCKDHRADAPGQFLTHYSPFLVSYILLRNGCDNKQKVDGIKKIDDGFLQTAVLVDFAGRNKDLESACLCYFDLSFSGDVSEASQQLFSLLRKAECVQNAKAILLPDFFSYRGGKVAAIFDRVYRAASGKYALLV